MENALPHFSNHQRSSLVISGGGRAFPKVLTSSSHQIVIEVPLSTSFLPVPTLVLAEQVALLDEKVRPTG